MMFAEEQVALDVLMDGGGDPELQQWALTILDFELNPCRLWLPYDRSNCGCGRRSVSISSSGTTKPSYYVWCSLSEAIGSYPISTTHKIRGDHGHRRFWY